MHAQYSSTRSLINTTQESESVTLLSSTVTFDKTKGFGDWEGNISVPSAQSVTVGMPWVYQDKATGNLMYTMNTMQSLNVSEDETPTPATDDSTTASTLSADSTQITGSTADPSSGTTGITESVGSNADTENTGIAVTTKNETTKPVMFPGRALSVSSHFFASRSQFAPDRL